MTRVNFYSKEQTDMLVADKQDKLTFDNEPTLDSTNPVTSNGIKMALDELQALIDSGYIHYGYLPPENPYLGMFWYNNAQGKLYICVGVEGTTGRWSLIVTSDGGATWGNIQGDLRNQLDLMAEFALKQDKLTAGAGIDITDNVVSSTVPVITVDAAPSATSENPLQNKVITQQLQNVSASVQNLEDEKQNKLTAGANITIENDVISASGIVDAYTKAETDNLLADKQKKLIAGTGISLDENGNISATGQIDAYTKAQTDTLLAQKQDTLSASQITAVNSGINSSKVSQYDNYDSRINAKQNTLVSGSNIKTINNQSILGSGNIDIQGGGSYSAGNGIDISNNVISVKTKPNGAILPSSSGIGISAGTGLRIVQDSLIADMSTVQAKLTAGNGIEMTGSTIKAKLGSGLEFDSNGAIKTTGGGSGGVSTINNIEPSSAGNIQLSSGLNSTTSLPYFNITNGGSQGNSFQLPMFEVCECTFTVDADENSSTGNVTFTRHYIKTPLLFFMTIDSESRDYGVHVKSITTTGAVLHSASNFRTSGSSTIYCLVIPRE